jgi:hypothetical protein
MASFLALRPTQCHAGNPQQAAAPDREMEKQALKHIKELAKKARYEATQKV